MDADHFIEHENKDVISVFSGSLNNKKTGYIW